MSGQRLIAGQTDRFSVALMICEGDETAPQQEITMVPGTDAMVTRSLVSPASP